METFGSISPPMSCTVYVHVPIYIYENARQKKIEKKHSSARNRTWYLCVVKAKR